MAVETAAPRTRSGLTPLCKLAEKYGTDKLGFYTPIYDLLLSGRRDQIYKVLEVGIGTPEAMKHVPGYRPGASLRMWRDYFPNADIYGLDINPNACAEAGEPDHRIFTFCADSTDPEIIPQLAVGGHFDLIVDDGDHEVKQQHRTFEVLAPLLTKNGLYIIEDAEWPVFGRRELEHTCLSNFIPGGIGRAIVIRRESVDG